MTDSTSSRPAAEAAATDDPATDAVLGGPRRRKTPAWLGWTIAVVFGLFFAYDVWEGVGNLVGVTIYAGTLDTTLSGTGWVVLLLGLVLPVVCFVVALVASRRMGVVPKVLTFAIALCVSAILALDLQLLFGFGTLIA